MFSAQNKLQITDFFGKPISYSGIRYECSPRDVFWAGLFEPFMIDAAKKLFAWVIDHCRFQNLEPTIYLVEARDLLRVYVEKTYRGMAETDRVLRGGGYPESVPLAPVDHEIKAMQSQIDDLLLAIAHSGKPSSTSDVSSSNVLKLEPNIYGIGFNLPALWQWLRKRLGM